jgi:tRNA nucleotidyltransferase (CCA-adding enzyme)
LSAEETEQLISRLRLAKSVSRALRDTIGLKTRLNSLADPKLPPSGIYSFLRDYSIPAVMANALASESPVTCQHIHLFLDKLRYVKPALSGRDLTRLGIAPGPKIKQTVNLLLEARLDGKASTKQDEENLVRKLLTRVER